MSWKALSLSYYYKIAAFPLAIKKEIFFTLIATPLQQVIHVQ